MNNGLTPPTSSLTRPLPTRGPTCSWTADPVTTEPFFLGANGNVNNNATGKIADADLRQHPYYRTEMLQKVMNLTTDPDASVRRLGHGRVLRGRSSEGNPQLARPVPTSSHRRVPMAVDQLGRGAGRHGAEERPLPVAIFLVDRTQGHRVQPVRAGRLPRPDRVQPADRVNPQRPGHRPIRRGGPRPSCNVACQAWIAAVTMESPLPSPSEKGLPMIARRQSAVGEASP